MFHCYGLTETATWVSDAPVDLNDTEMSVGDGLLWSTNFKIQDDGQIQVSTESLFAGYWGEWTPDSPKIQWYETGDLGRLNSKNQLILTGRKKRQINRGGVKVSPEEVEVAILETELVKEVVVVETPMRQATDAASITAIAITESVIEQTELIAKIESQIRTTLSPSKIPSSWHFVSKIPRRTNGKPDLAEIGLLLSKLMNV